MSLKRLDLNEIWRVRWADGQRGRPEYANRDAIDESRYLSAQVPGEVHLDLIATIVLNGREIVGIGPQPSVRTHVQRVGLARRQGARARQGRAGHLHVGNELRGMRLTQA